MSSSSSVINAGIILYHKSGIQIAEWLSKVKECQINSSTKKIADSLKGTHLEEEEEVVSFNVSSLYTNIPVNEAIESCADILYYGKKDNIPPSTKLLSSP